MQKREQRNGTTRGTKARLAGAGHTEEGRGETRGVQGVQEGAGPSKERATTRGEVKGREMGRTRQRGTRADGKDEKDCDEW